MTELSKWPAIHPFPLVLFKLLCLLIRKWGRRDPRAIDLSVYFLIILTTYGLIAYLTNKKNDTFMHHILWISTKQQDVGDKYPWQKKKKTPGCRKVYKSVWSKRVCRSFTNVCWGLKKKKQFNMETSILYPQKIFIGHTWVKQKANYIHLSKERRLVEGTAIISLHARKRKSECVCVNIPSL